MSIDTHGIGPEAGDGPDAFAFVSFELDGRSRPGFVVADLVYDLGLVLPDVYATSDLFARWEQNLDDIAAIVADPAALGALASHLVHGIQILPPVQPIGPIFAAGANYREHILQMSVAHNLGRSDATDDELWAEAAAENDERRRSGDPYIWTGVPSAVSGAYDDVLLPDVGEDIDWELELGVVIGSRAHRVAVEDAYDYVAGYTIVNDITSRSLVPRKDMALIGTDWFRAKNQPTFFPTGPYLVPKRFVPDPTALTLELKLNGEVKQHATTDDMLFDIPSLISYASSIAILQPGDMLITGSPAGNGSHWKRFLQGGDVMEASITGLGVQRTRVRAHSGVAPPWQARR